MTAPASMTAPDAPLRGIGCLTLGVCVFVGQDVIMKALSGAYALHEMLFIRCVTGLPFILAVALWQGNVAAFRLHRAAAVRGALHFLSFSCYYLALAALPMAETATLYYASPLFITALSVPFLGEAVGWRRWTAVLVGFAGVVVVLRPGVSTIEPAMLLALASAFIYASAMLVTRAAGGRIPSAGFALHSVVMLLVLSSIVGAIAGDGRFVVTNDVTLGYLFRAWSAPSGWDLALLAATGPISAAGFVLLSEAYRIAPPSLVTPFEYSSLPVAVLSGFIVFGDLPASGTWLGLALIVGAGLYILRRETVRGRANKHR